jgi:hypothetical protein
VTLGVYVPSRDQRQPFWLWEVDMRALKVVFGAVMLGGALFGANAAFGASMPSGGHVQVFVTPGGHGTGTILIAGAIGDHGKTVWITKDGKIDPNGNYSKITLQKGAFVVNLTALEAKINSGSGTSSIATCSYFFGATAPAALSGGTGLYKGISGTVNVSEWVGVLGSLYKSGTREGQCNQSNNAPVLDQAISVTGTGTVKFN